MADSKKASPKKSGGKKTKNKTEQTSDILSFATKVVAAGAVASAVSRRGSKKTKRMTSVVIFLLCIVIFAVGVMYYFDVPPLNFGDGFKFYTYEVNQFDTPTATVSGELNIHFIDVGQGDCIFIQFPDGKTMLIDGGERRTAVATGIPQYLFALYPSQDTITIDYCMLTHCDSDHCGSLDDVIANPKINVKSVYQPRVYSKCSNDPLRSLMQQNPNAYKHVPEINTGVYESFVEAVYQEKLSGVLTEINYNFEGQIISGSDYSIHTYNPSEEMYGDLSTAYEKNDISPLMVLTYGNYDILLTGDCDKNAEQNFVDNLNGELTFADGFVWDGDCEVLKVGHHGGRDSTNQFFIDTVKPEYAVISVAEKNKHGHPTQDALSRIDKYTDEIYMTSKLGSIAMRINKDGISWANSLKTELPFTAIIQISLIAQTLSMLNSNYCRYL
ncbi:MAG: MBL fold metallo-hydrolase [Clostridia bacterium]